jgi:hypothetical protein
MESSELRMQAWSSVNGVAALEQSRVDQQPDRKPKGSSFKGNTASNTKPKGAVDEQTITWFILRLDMKHVTWKHGNMWCWRSVVNIRDQPLWWNQSQIFSWTMFHCFQWGKKRCVMKNSWQFCRHIEWSFLEQFNPLQGSGKSNSKTTVPKPTLEGTSSRRRLTNEWKPLKELCKLTS